MTDRVQIELPNSPLLAVDKAVKGFAKFAEFHQVPTRICQDVHLALDEIVSNLILHGYRDSEPHHIVVTISIDADFLEVELIDDAESFSVLDKEDPQTDLPLEQRPTGGLGIYLVKRLMDEVDYFLREDLNHLRLKKRL